jgi:phage terminase large subunit
MPNSQAIEFPEKLQFLFSPARYKVLHGGRGGAKSWGAARALILACMAGHERILCAREIQKSIQDSVHKLISDQIAAMGLSAAFRITENVIYGPNDSEFLFAGLRQQNVTSIKSFEGVTKCWVEEAQTVSKRSWDILIPTIRKDGSEIWVTFNPELDSDETYVRFVEQAPDDAVVVQINYGDNPWFPSVLEKERLDWLRRDPEGYKTTWLGQCRPAVEGAIYAKEIAQAYEQNRIIPLTYDPLIKVHTIWDLGWNDSMSILLVQRTAGEVRIIDHITDSLRTLDYYVGQLRDKRHNGASYNWGTDYIPHDGAARDFKTGKSTEELLKAMERNPKLIPNIGVEEGIRAARMMFLRTYFNKPATVDLINSLKRYKRREQANGVFSSPLHDDNSHDADAFRYLGVVVEELGNNTHSKAPKLHFNNRMATSLQR